jgi:uncharacterized protein (TIGR02147 family)
MKIATYLKLSLEEIEYLNLLHDKENSKSPEQKKHIDNKMSHFFKRNKFIFTQLKDEHIMKNPLFCFMLETLDLYPLPYDMMKLNLFFRNKFSVFEIQQTLQCMIEKDLISVTSDFQIVKNKSDHFFFESDKKNLAIQEYHKKICQMASESLSEQELHERIFSGISINIDQNKIPEVQLYFKNVITDFIAKFCDSNSLNSKTYQFSLNLFNVSDDQHIKKGQPYEN